MAVKSISIIIPCYNDGAMLLEALASIDRVRNENVFEIIIVNDGSTHEQTCQILQDLPASKYKVINQPNRGLGAARNAGIAIAEGEIILPLDSDNYIRATYFTEGVKVFSTQPSVGVVYGDAEFFGGKTGRWRVSEFDLGLIVMGNYIDACALYRKRVWESVGGYDEKMPWMGWEDWDFWLRAAMQGWGFIHLDQIAFDYRVRVGSMLTETDRHRRELIEHIFKKPENKLLAIIRRQNQEIAKLDKIHLSFEYRTAHKITWPIRYMRRIFANHKEQGERIERLQDIEF